MKIQDIAGLTFLVLFIAGGKSRLLPIAGLAFLILAIPLFHFRIFYTAQKLVMYAALYFSAAVVYYIVRYRKETRI